MSLRNTVTVSDDHCHCMQGEQQRLALAQETTSKACQEAKEAQSVAASERKRSAFPLVTSRPTPHPCQDGPDQPPAKSANHTSADEQHVRAETMKQHRPAHNRVAWRGATANAPSRDHDPYQQKYK